MQSIKKYLLSVSFVCFVISTLAIAPQRIVTTDLNSSKSTYIVGTCTNKHTRDHHSQDRPSNAGKGFTKG